MPEQQDNKRCVHLSTFTTLQAGPNVPPEMVGQQFPLVAPCLKDKCHFWFTTQDQQGNIIGECTHVVVRETLLDQTLIMHQLLQITADLANKINEYLNNDEDVDEQSEQGDDSEIEENENKGE